ncbi:MAG: hypothetical protein NUV80_02305 [Candidatus Berkelbacteria bacterium]|nr:hypothetical protein [Candidatus Berkelbacteria bacterium]
MAIVTHIYGISARGRTELIKHLDKKRLTAKQAVIAQCYDCMGGYTDGKYSCDKPDCPLYPFMPYRNVEKRS